MYTETKYFQPQTNSNLHRKIPKKSEDLGASSHWGLFSFGARICCERKRLMTSQHHIINWIRPIFSFLQTYLSRVIGLKSYKVSIFSRRNWKSLTTVCLSWSASFPSDKSLMNSAVIFFQSQYFYVLPKSKQCTFISRGSGMLQLISVSESFSSPQHFLLFRPPDITLDRTTSISRLSSTRFLLFVLFSSGVTFPLMLDLAILHHTGCFFHWHTPELMASKKPISK